MATILRLTRAIYDYTAEEEDQLSFNSDDILGVLAEDDPDWPVCTLKSPNVEAERIGCCPANYLEDAQPLYRVVVLYQYSPSSDDELELQEGHLLDVYLETSDGWLVAGLLDAGGAPQYGMVPANYVERADQNDYDALPASPDAASPPKPFHPQLATAPPPILAPSPALVSNLAQAAPAAATGPALLATALYTFTTQEPGDLDIREGENCLVLDDHDPDWIKARLISSHPDRSNKEGYVPRDYLHIKEVTRANSTPAPVLPVSPPTDPAPAFPSHTSASSRSSQPSALSKVFTSPPAVPFIAKSEPPPAASEPANSSVAASSMASARPNSPPLPPRPASHASLTSPLLQKTSTPVVPSLPIQPAQPVLPVQSTGKSAPKDPPKPLSTPLPHREPPDATKVRVWLDQSGTHKTEAAFVDFQDGKVKLHKVSGLKIDVPVSALHTDDQILVHQLKGLPIPPHLQDAPAPAKPPSRKASLLPVFPKVEAAALKPLPEPAVALNGPVAYNGFDWLDYFKTSGIEEHDARLYAVRFAAEKLDSTALTDLTRETLKDLAVKEGDILRILRHGSNLAKAREREAELAAQNLEKIEQYFTERARISENSVASSAMPQSMNILAAKEQLKRDEEFARRLQEEEMKSIGKVAASKSSMMKNDINATSSINPRRQSAKNMHASHNAVSAATIKASNSVPADPLAGLFAMAAAPAAKAGGANSAAQPVAPLSTGSYVVPTSITGESSALGGLRYQPPNNVVSAQSYSASQSIGYQLTPQMQPQFQQHRASLPAPLIPAQSSMTGFMPTKVTSNHTGQSSHGMMGPPVQQYNYSPAPMQQQMQPTGMQHQNHQMSFAQPLQPAPPQTQMLLNDYQHPSQMANSSMSYSQSQLNSVLPAVSVSSTGRAANWQNATPDNPFGKSLAGGSANPSWSTPGTGTMNSMPNGSMHHFAGLGAINAAMPGIYNNAQTSFPQQQPQYGQFASTYSNLTGNASMSQPNPGSQYHYMGNT